MGDHFLCGVRFPENLTRNLTKVVDEADNSPTFDRVINGVDVHIAFVEEMVEYVGCLNSGLSALFVAEDQVDPVMKIGRDVLAF